MKLEREIMKEIVHILQDRDIITKVELLDLSYEAMLGNVPKYQIMNAWNRIKDEELVVPANELHPRCYRVSAAGTRFLKGDAPKISLMEAVMYLYRHRDKNKRLSFTIQFTDGSGRAVIIDKSWNKVLDEWRYSIGEMNCPGLASDEYGFIGNLANVDGISFGGNIPGYYVYHNLM